MNGVPEIRPELPDATVLAVDRTRLAFERTLLAWVRTATGLITFGFSVYKFFQYQQAAGVQPPRHLISTREFAIIMMGIGLIMLLLATLEHSTNIRRLRRQYGNVPRSLAGVVAALMSILGMLGLLAAVLHQ